jgi:anti-anti-sigma factor
MRRNHSPKKPNDKGNQMESSDINATTRVVRLSGRLGSPEVDKLEIPFTAMTAAAGKHALVDLSAVTFIGSMGIRMLISAARAMQRKGLTLVLFGAQEMVQEVLDQVSLGDIIPLVADEQAALAQLNN